MSQHYPTIPFIEEDLWWTDMMGYHFRQSYRIKKVLHQEKTPYQTISIMETYDLGRVLILDGSLQTTEKDEYFYHEQLVHPAMHLCDKDALKVLIFGGGDGGCSRECLKYPHVQSVTMVEIDQQVPLLTQKYLPTLWQLPNGKPVFEDPRFHLIIQDGFDWLNNQKGKLAYDLVIVDVSDPSGPSLRLFGSAFYQTLRDCLPEDSLMVVQGENPIYGKSHHENIYKAIQENFPDATPYWGCVPSYPGGIWAYVMAGAFDPGLKEEGSFERVQKKHKDFMKQGVTFRFYSPIWHKSCFRWVFIKG